MGILWCLYQVPTSLDVSCVCACAHLMETSWMSHVSHMNESCHTYEWVMSHIWMSHVTHMNESCHTYESHVCVHVRTWRRHHVCDLGLCRFVEYFLVFGVLLPCLLCATSLSFVCMWHDGHPLMSPSSAHILWCLHHTRAHLLMSPSPHKNTQFHRANQTVSHFDRSLLGCCGQFCRSLWRILLHIYR